MWTRLCYLVQHFYEGARPLNQLDIGPFYELTVFND